LRNDGEAGVTMCRGEMLHLSTTPTFDEDLASGILRVGAHCYTSSAMLALVPESDLGRAAPAFAPLFDFDAARPVNGTREKCIAETEGVSVDTTCSDGSTGGEAMTRAGLEIAQVFRRGVSPMESPVARCPAPPQ
jgi:hypothetical protein